MYALKDIQGYGELFDRKTGRLRTGGVYFWGFYLGNDSSLMPDSSAEMIIYYIGKDERDVLQRMMQEITQLLVGGFGIIFDTKRLKNNPYNANLYDIRTRCDSTITDILYRPDGLHTLYRFYTDKRVREAIDWMFNRLIFTWIADDEKTPSIIEHFERRLDKKLRLKLEKDGRPYSELVKKRFLKSLELELHSIVGRNVLGLGSKPPKSRKISESDQLIFNSINWDASPCLYDWLKKVNSKQFENAQP